ncbi:Uncharacterised protein [Vibrio cholerae]|nr:Uncharacterised protein [Vibrio cholerae]
MLKCRQAHHQHRNRLSLLSHLHPPLLRSTLRPSQHPRLMQREPPPRLALDSLDQRHSPSE